MRWLLPLVLCAACFALPPTFTVPARNPQPLPAGTSVAETNFIKQNFEGTGYDNGETWVTDGAADPNATTSPTPYEASEYLKIGATTSDGAGRSFAAKTEAVFEFWTQIDTVGANSGFFYFGNSGFANNILLQINSGPQLVIIQSGGAVAASTTDAPPIDTWIHIWVRWDKGASGSVYASVGFSEDDIEPTSGNKFASFNNGTQVFDCTDIYFQGRAISQMSFDKIRGWVP